MLLVKIGKYVAFYLYRRSCLLWPPVIVVLLVVSCCCCCLHCWRALYARDLLHSLLVASPHCSKMKTYINGAASCAVGTAAFFTDVPLPVDVGTVSSMIRLSNENCIPRQRGTVSLYYGGHTVVNRTKYC